MHFVGLQLLNRFLPFLPQILRIARVNLNRLAVGDQQDELFLLRLMPGRKLPAFQSAAPMRVDRQPPMLTKRALMALWLFGW